MSKLRISNLAEEQKIIDNLFKDLGNRISSTPIGTCPVEMAQGCLAYCHAQTCGKCVPCRIGLSQLKKLLNDVLDGKGGTATLDAIKELAEDIVASADCAIGTTAASIVLKSFNTFYDDYVEHVMNNNCLANFGGPMPCVEMCPANVDIPGYLALVHEGRSTDAVRLIRRDNPFPTACALVCEHPCEAHCRRGVLDEPVNIRGIKRYAVDNMEDVAPPANATPTGKHIAVIGGGPAGLSAAYYLTLMGHKVTVFEKNHKLGGMLRYGIPEYRFPKARLDKEIEYILSTGMEVFTDFEIGKDTSIETIRENHDAVYVSIGAHKDKKLGIEGENAEGVMSAIKLLGDMGNDIRPDFTGKRVVVVGGGNVAMDAVRSSVRLGASVVSCIYRRREQDMTALYEEIKGAKEEKVRILELLKPVRIETENGKVTAMVVQPQIIGGVDRSGRPAPRDASVPEKKIKADIIIVAIGQAIDTPPFENLIPARRGLFITEPTTAIAGTEGLFAGGDCVSGPATAIKAIANGKIAARNIDNYLGFDHKISVDIDIPEPVLCDKTVCGRVGINDIPADKRSHNFECIESGLTTEEAMQETWRCLRCDHFGFAQLKGGRKTEW